MLWLTLLVGLGVGYFILSRRLVEQQRELAKLREEVGYFAVEDPSKIQVLSVPSHDAGAMNGRSICPPDSRWDLHCKPRTSPVRLRRLSGPGGSLTGQGQFVLETFLSRDTDDQRRFSFQVGGATTSFQLSDDEVQERFAAAAVRAAQGRHPALEILEPADRVELLRYRVNCGRPARDFDRRYQAGDGGRCLIWLERYP